MRMAIFASPRVVGETSISGAPGNLICRTSPSCNTREGALVSPTVEVMGGSGQVWQPDARRHRASPRAAATARLAGRYETPARRPFFDRLFTFAFFIIFFSLLRREALVDCGNHLDDKRRRSEERRVG